MITIGHVAFAGNRFIATLHSVALGATPLQIGTLMGAAMLCPMLMAVHVGRWADRFGYGRVGVTGFAILLCAGPIAATWATLPALYASNILTGVGFMSMNLAANNAVGKNTPDEYRINAFSALAMGFAISGMSGPLISGFMIDHVGFRLSYLLLLVFPLTSLGLLWFALRKYPPWPVPPDVHKRARVADLLREKPLRAVFITGGLMSLGWDLFGFLAPLQGVAAGLSASATGMIMGGFGIGNFTVRLMIARLARRFGEWGVMSGALLGTAVGFVVFPLLHDFAALVAAALFLGMVLGCAQPMSMTLLYRAAPQNRAGEAVGIRSTITSVGQTTLPMLFGAMGSAIGVGAMCWAAALVIFAGGIVATRRATKLRKG